MLRKTCFFGLCLMLGFSLMSTQCSRDEAEMSQVVIMKDIELTARSTSWEVSYFLESGVDKTEAFQKMSFSFNPDGSLEVLNKRNFKYSGAWAVDGSIKETAETKFQNIDFRVYFATPSQMKVLNKTWNISNYTTNEIELVVHHSGGQIDYLKLERTEDL